MIMKSAKYLLLGILCLVLMEGVFDFSLVFAKGDVKVYQYAINIYELDNFRISAKQKKKIVDRIVGGFNAWNGFPDVCVKFEYVGFSNAKYKSGDKVNVVYLTMDEDGFKKIQKRVGAGDALAVTKRVGDEFDVIFWGEGFLGMSAKGLYLNFHPKGSGMANDLQSAMAHEAGHALGLKHSSESNAVMYKRLPRTTRHSPIEDDDITNARNLYPCPKDTKTSYMPPDGWQPYGESIAVPGVPVSDPSQTFDQTTQEIADKQNMLQDREAISDMNYGQPVDDGSYTGNAYDSFGAPEVHISVPVSDDHRSDQGEGACGDGLCSCGSGVPYEECHGAI